MSEKKKYRTKVTKKTITIATYYLTDPEGVVHKTDNLFKFCQEHGLSQGNMSSVISGRYSQHKGWTGKMTKRKKVITKKEKIEIKERKGNPNGKPPVPKKITMDEFIGRATAKFEGKYDYRYVTSETFVDVNSVVKVICPEHGTFHVVARTHMQSSLGSGKCPECPSPVKAPKSKPKPPREAPFIRSKIRRYMFKNKKDFVFVDALDRRILFYLEAKGFTRDDIVIWDDFSAIPIIKWFPNRMDKKEYRIHHVDVYVKKTNTIIFPIFKKEDLNDSRVLKIRDQCIRDGYRFEMWHFVNQRTLKQIYI